MQLTPDEFALGCGRATPSLRTSPRPGSVGSVVGGPYGERLSVVVSQATGMVAAQVGCDLIEAFDRIKIRADAMGQSLQDTVLDIIDGVIRFDV